MQYATSKEGEKKWTLQKGTCGRMINRAKPGHWEDKRTDMVVLPNWEGIAIRRLEGKKKICQTSAGTYSFRFLVWNVRPDTWVENQRDNWNSWRR